MENYEKTVKAIKELGERKYPEEGLEHLSEGFLCSVVNGIPMTGVNGPKVMQDGDVFKLGYMVEVTGHVQSGFAVEVPTRDELDRLGREYGFDTSNVGDFVDGLEGRSFDYGEEDIPEAAKKLEEYFRDHVEEGARCSNVTEYVDTFRDSGSAQIHAQLQLGELALGSEGYEIVSVLAERKGIEYLMKNY
ncbi:hypothetical protein CL618_01155 [archaeon]|nr:hypothetical protein [archaeon]